MAYFAQLNEMSVVLNILVIDDQHVNSLSFPESEPIGVAYLKNAEGSDTNWVQTCVNGSFRKNYASIGCTYDVERRAFIAPKPFMSWVLNEDTCCWEAPVSRPTTTDPYIWDETTTSWIEQI